MTRPQYVHVIDTGKVRITRESHSSFRGKHNSTKSKILLQLYSVWSRGDHDGLCLSELTSLTGTSPLSLQTLLPRWVKWAYVRRKAKIFNDRPVFSYLIDDRGRKFCEIRIPPRKREELINEIQLSRISNKTKREAS